MTHEVLSMLTLSDGSSNEIEDTGEVSCPQSSISGLQGLSHVLCCHLKMECLFPFGIGRIQLKWNWTRQLVLV